MGKIRRPRKKAHLTSVHPKEPAKASTINPASEFKSSPLNLPPQNPFAGLNIDTRRLNRLKPDDAVSLKSFKSVKSELGADRALSKREKLRLKKDLLLRKIDTVNQSKREAALRRRRRNVAIIGDTNPLRDALPDLQSLLKSGDGGVGPKGPVAAKRAIAKERKRKRDALLHVHIYKELTKRDDFKGDPMAAISGHVRAAVEHGQL